MKKCPKCKRVFDDTWKNCLHCNVELVNESLVQGEPGPLKEQPNSIFSWILIAAGVVFGIWFFVFAIGGLVSQIFFAPIMYHREAEERFLRNIDQQSKAEILEVIRNYEEEVLNHPRDREKRVFLEKLKNRSKQRLLEKTSVK